MSSSHETVNIKVSHYSLLTREPLSSFVNVQVHDKAAQAKCVDYLSQSDTVILCVAV